MPDNDKRLIDIDDLYRIAYIEDVRVSPDGEWIAYVQAAPDRIENSYQRNIWLAPTDGGAPVQVTRSGKDTQPRWSPDGTRLAFTSARSDKPQVYVLPVGAPGGEARCVTSQPYGASSPAWSPDGTRIAFLGRANADERAKEDSGEDEEPPADKFEAKQRKDRREHEEGQRWDPRPMARIPYREGTGYRDDRTAQVYVVTAAEGAEGDDAKPRRLTDIDADHDELYWSPDGAALYTARTSDPELDEYWRWSTLYRIRVEDGETERLTGEDFLDAAPLPSPDGAWIAYARTPVERMTESMPRLALLPAAGGDPRDLTLAFDRAIVGYRWAADSSALYFTADTDGNREIYRVSPEGGEIEKVVPGRMEVQSFDVGPDGGIALVAMTPTALPELFWQPRGADEPLQLTDANRKFLDEVTVQETHEIWFTGLDGTQLQGWYILPPEFEEGKQYPLAFNIHGGPHVMWGPSARSMWHEWQLHAARGYVVFYMNPRGADGYGQKFLSDLHAAWGDVAFDDLMAGVDEMLKLGFVDPDRMVVTGGSYGGYMTAWVVGHTDRFKAAVTQRGVYNLVSFYGTSDVPLLISNEYDVEPWEDPQLLWEHSPLAYAHRIKTPLLIIHSENDFRVPIEQGEQLFAFVRRSTDTPVKMLRYPRDGHELSRSGEPRHRVSRLTEMMGWFETYLNANESE